MSFPLHRSGGLAQTLVVWGLRVPEGSYVLSSELRQRRCIPDTFAMGALIMPKRTVVKDPSDLPRIVDIIHDCWFDLGRIQFDAGDSALTIPFRRERSHEGSRLRWSDFFSRARGRGFECFLRIGQVDSYSVVDTQKVRIYDFNELTYDPETKRIRITTGVPLEMSVTVKDLDVSVEETDKVVEYG
jgi:hypothetical protein